jgi:hypothetical protein
MRLAVPFRLRHSSLSKAIVKYIFHLSRLHPNLMPRTIATTYIHHFDQA